MITQRTWAAVLAAVATLVALGTAGAQASTPKPTTQRMDVSSSEKQANCQALNGSVSGDGRFVVFSSCATNLVGTPTAPWGQVYLRDRATGKTKLLSQSAHGHAGDRDSGHPVISDTGRYVVFQSSATNLGFPNKHAVEQLVRLDRQTGKFTLVSETRGGGAPNGASGESESAISDNGRFIAFISRATNLVSNTDTDNYPDVFLRDMREHKTVLVSRTVHGHAATAIGNVQMNGTGHYVVYQSGSDKIVPDEDAGVSAFLYDRVSKSTISLSQNAMFNDIPQHDGSEPTIAGDASEACFVGSGGAGDPKYQIWCTPLHFAAHGVPDTPQFADYTKVTAVLPDGPDGDSGHPVLSKHGNWVAFSSNATNLGPTDTNQALDVYLSPVGGDMKRASVTYQGHQASNGGGGTTIDISDSGRYVLFDSSSSNLVPHDTNNSTDLFLRTR